MGECQSGRLSIVDFALEVSSDDSKRLLFVLSVVSIAWNQRDKCMSRSYFSAGGE